MLPLTLDNLGERGYLGFYNFNTLLERNMKKHHSLNVLTLAVYTALSGAAIAQEASASDADAKSKEKFEQIVVTAAPGGATTQEASVSVSVFDEENILKLAPRSTSGVLR